MKKTATIAFLATCTLLAVLFFYLLFNPPEFVDREALLAYGQDINGWVYALAYAILPVFGFPMSVLFFVAGMKFGLVGGSLLSAASIACHLLLAYAISHSFLQKPLTRLLDRMDYSLPQWSRTGEINFAALVVAAPMLSYAIKLYLLALSPVRFHVYFFVSWIIHTVTGIAMIGLGNSAADLNPFWLFAFFLIIVLMTIISQYLKKRYERLSESRDDGEASE